MKKPKAEQIYQLLRKAIIFLDMPPGAIIVERELCQQYGVSRTPIREALKRLEEEGLVDVFPHSGTYVSRISYNIAREGYIIRRALEIIAVRQAATLIDQGGKKLLSNYLDKMEEILSKDRLGDYLAEDDNFHAHIAMMSGFPRIWKFIDMAKVHLDRMRQLSAPIPHYLQRVTNEHRQIYQAILSGEPDQAELAMRIHLDSSFETMTKLYGNYRDLFVRNEEDDK